MKNTRLGIIAGTLVDTQMGVDFFSKKGIKSIGFPVSNSPEEQSLLQILSPVQLFEMMRQKLKEIKDNKINHVCVYCNSLSAAVDLDKLAREEKINIITPLHIYKEMAAHYHYLGVIAANNQSAAGIERIIQAQNNNCMVVGIGLLPLVLEIERKCSPREIVLELGLDRMVDFFNHLNVEAIVVGCTHFPYVIPQLECMTNIPFIDPAEIMVSKIKQLDNFD